MQVYQTDSNGYFSGIVQADESPLEPGVWLLPGGAVDEVPPQCGAGEIARWYMGGWQIESLPKNPDAPPPEPETPEEIKDRLTAFIDDYVEAAAKLRQYNGAAHLASYVASTVPEWAAEAQGFVAWRDQVWLTVIAEMIAVEAGEKQVPTEAELTELLPPMNWN